ncbi:PRD domain-containing protein [Lachnospiraceae bacterium 54-53]
MELREILYRRLDILEENQVICREVADYSRKVTERILEIKPDTEEDKAAMFITHLAMAGQRVLDHGSEQPLDDAILEGVKREPIYETAVALRDELLQETDLRFPESERDFLTVHLCNLLS